ncbi:CoA transferase [Bradyrhizobium sp. CW7]|uniref:CoA transferase n=1 Tax=Bradyrhizobium sp. CW7 TaxID=2782688 RepID=UPI0020971FF4|nr:CoA transferase [Bradyrhizobium sp. CW7]
MKRSREVLSQLRVVEIGSSAATSYCARLFADFGAEVWKVEPPSADPLRSSAPLTPGGQKCVVRVPELQQVKYCDQSCGSGGGQATDTID